MTKVTEHLHTLFLSCLLYLHSIDQIHNLDKILTSFLTDLTSTHKGLDIGGPTTSDIHLQQQTPFCFSRQNSVNNSYPQLGTMPPHHCNYTLHLSFPSGLSVYNISGTSGHSFAFSGRLPSTYGINTPFVGATLASSLSVSETTNKFPERLLFAINFSCLLSSYTWNIFLIWSHHLFVFPLIGQEHAPWYI